MELTVESFAVWRFIHAVLGDDHMIHLEGVTPLICKYMPCKRAVKLLSGGHNLLCQGMTFAPRTSATFYWGIP